ncbi:hypothetical protein CUJ91_23695 [Paraburkholderia graminis]|nr:hypothetical protein CUJ91_23695 [Paraburkholderia graminis]
MIVYALLFLWSTALTAIPMALRIKHAFSVVRVLCIFLVLTVCMQVVQTFERFAERRKARRDNK